MDDDQDACDLLCLYLSGAGYEADVRFDAPSALEAFHAAPYDVVITDVRMPGMDGIELLQSIKSIDPDTGVIVVSALLEDSVRHAIDALRLGAYDYFLKPVEDLARLEHAVAAAVEVRAGRRERALQITELEQLARTDPLTGLANRRELEQRLREEFSRLERGAEEFALALFDIDSFKSINETYLHPAGDEVLRTVADAMRANCRAYDVKARYGGDEFVVVMPDTRLEQGVAVMEKIRRAVAAQSFPGLPGPLQVTLSAGITSTGPREGITPEGLIRRADRALFEAKKAGRNQIFALSQTGPAAEVLLIEDDPGEADAVARMCEVLGCRADWARTGSAGLERAKLTRYGLALVNLELPDGPGTEVLARLRQISPATATALVTGADPQSTRVLEAVSRFPVTLARKPLSIEHLKSLLTEARRRT